MGFPSGLTADLRVRLVDDGKFVVLGDVGASGDSKVRRTGGHSHHVTIDEIVEVHI